MDFCPISFFLLRLAFNKALYEKLWCNSLNSVDYLKNMKSALTPKTDQQLKSYQILSIIGVRGNFSGILSSISDLGQ